MCLPARGIRIRHRLGQKQPVDYWAKAHARLALDRLDQLFRRQAAQLGKILDPQPIDPCLVAMPVSGHGGWRHRTKQGAALANDLLKEPLRRRYGCQGIHRKRTGAFTEDGDVAGIATKGRDVRLDPFERRDHVHQAVITGMPSGFLVQIVAGQKAKDIQAVVQRDKDDTLRWKRGVGVSRFGACSGKKAAAVDPDHYRQPGRRICLCGDIDVQVQAVFRGSRIEKDVVIPDVPLFAAAAELRCVAHALPRLRRLRSLPPQCAYRRRGIGQAEERLLCAIHDPLALRLACRSLHDRRVHLGTHRDTMRRHKEGQNSSEQTGA